MIRVLVTRPRPDAEATARRLAVRGYETVVDPLLSVRWSDAPLPSLDGVQALLFTSANGVRALTRRGAVPDLPAWTVGAASAACATAAGFTRVITGDGDVTALAARVARDLRPADGALLHIAGAAVAGDLAGNLAAAGFSVHRVVAYEAVAANSLAPATCDLLATRGLAAILFFSPRTANVFVKLVVRAGLAASCRNVEALCLSPACAQAASRSDGGSLLSWNAVRVAGRPNEDSLLALLPERSGS